MTTPKHPRPWRLDESDHWVILDADDERVARLWNRETASEVIAAINAAAFLDVAVFTCAHCGHGDLIPQAACPACGKFPTTEPAREDAEHAYPTPPYTPEQQQRLDEARARWDEKLKPLTDGIREANRITEHDLALRVGEAPIPPATAGEPGDEVLKSVYSAAAYPSRRRPLETLNRLGYRALYNAGFSAGQASAGERVGELERTLMAARTSRDNAVRNADSLRTSVELWAKRVIDWDEGSEIRGVHALLEAVELDLNAEHERAVAAELRARARDEA